MKSENEQIEKDNYPQFLLRFARECLAKKNYHETDLALQVCQDRNPTDPLAYNLQAKLAYQLGLFEQAKRFVDKALSLNPGFKKAAENKTYIERELNKPVGSNDSERYMLIHSWGNGLGYDLLYLLKQLLLAELTDRKPMVYWGKNSLYNNNSEVDCFTDYFDPVSDLSFDDIEPFQGDCFPEYWQSRKLSDYLRRTRWKTKSKQQYRIVGLYYLNRDEQLVVSGEFTTVKMLKPWIPESHRLYGASADEIYRDLIKKYIHPKQHLQQRANSFVKREFAQKPFIAIHLRGTDKKQEKQSQDIATINQNLIAQLEQLDKDLPIFVMTDDVRQIKSMKQRFGERIRSIDVTRSDSDEEGVHHIANDKQKIAEEVIVDMLVASQADTFFGYGLSYLACCVNAFRSKEQVTVLSPFNITTRFYEIPYPGKFDIY